MQKVNKVICSLLLAMLPALTLILLDNEQFITPTQIPTVQAADSPTQDTNLSRERDLLRVFFRKYRCPLFKNTDELIDSAIATGLDWSLLPAIAFRESTCGKRQLGNNPFGFGYYKFDSFSDAINYVAQAISAKGTKDAKHYRSAHLEPRLILQKYNKNPSYTDRVLQTMAEIKKSGD